MIQLSVCSSVHKRVEAEFFFNFRENFQNKFCIISRKISKNFENHFGKFGRIISRNSLEIIKKYFGLFRELFRKVFKIKSLRKISKIISENFGKLPEIFLEISRNINEIFENYFETCF